MVRSETMTLSNVETSSSCNHLVSNEVDNLMFNKKKDFVWHSQPQHNSSEGLITRTSLTDKSIGCKSMLDFFDILIDSKILNKICEYTNKKITDDEPLSEIELRAYFGLLLMLGVTKKRSVDVSEIWSYDSVHHLDFANACMTRKRFQLISAKITFDDISTRSYRIKDKFSKFSEIFNIFQDNNSGLVNPGNNLCVDEQLYSFRGRCNFKQYMPSKPGKYGIKYWSIVDVETSIVLKSSVYLGKVTEARQTNVGENVVLNLASSYFNSSVKRTITADNFFSSINLIKTLYDKNILYCGTLRKNKSEIPVDFLVSKNKEVNLSSFGFNNYISICSFIPKKNRTVILISSRHHQKDIDESSKKPLCIGYYNANKGGVDTVDHLIENFTCRRATKRWTYNAMMYLLDFAAHNSYCMFKLLNPALYHNRRARRINLENISKKLMDPLIKHRVETIGKDPNGYHSNLIESMKRVGYPVSKKRANTDTIPSNNQRKRCFSCPREKDAKVSKTCSVCNRFVCKVHSKELNTKYCNECIYND